MKITFLIDNLKFSGGRKTFVDFAAHLKSKGHDVVLLSLSAKGELGGIIDVQIVGAFSPDSIPTSDFIVTTTPDEVAAAQRSGRGRVVHICQGFEIEDLQNRVDGKVLPNRYQGNSLFSRIIVAKKKREWKAKIRELDKVYGLDTILIAISPHIKEVVEKRYHRQAHYCRYGVKKEYFFHGREDAVAVFSAEKPCRIINIGPVNVTFKGIPDTIAAVAKVKERKIPVHFIRVSPDDRRDEDLKDGIIDEYHRAVTPQALGELMRSCHLYISNSLEGEGFGLPAMEAMSCGTIPVLSSISSYMNFDPVHDYAIFVPERDPDKTAEAIIKFTKMDLKERDAIRRRAIEVSGNYSMEDTYESFENVMKKNCQ